MDLTEVRLLGVLGMVVVGLVTTAGAVALSLLAAGVVQAGLTIVGWLGRIRSPAAGVGKRAAERVRTPVVEQGFRLGEGDHALLARQAWWRLRC